MRRIVGGVITLVWALAFIVGSLKDDYSAFQLASGIMVIYTGALFGIEIYKGKKNGNGKPPDA